MGGHHCVYGTFCLGSGNVCAFIDVLMGMSANVFTLEFVYVCASVCVHVCSCKSVHFYVCVYMYMNM